MHEYLQWGRTPGDGRVTAGARVYIITRADLEFPDKMFFSSENSHSFNLKLFAKTRFFIRKISRSRMEFLVCDTHSIVQWLGHSCTMWEIQVCTLNKAGPGYRVSLSNWPNE